MVGIKVSPPFIIENLDGKYSGVSVDLWSMISQKLGVGYEYKVYKQNEIKNMLADVESGKLDISINPLTVTSERIQRLDFTQPFYTSNLAIAAQIVPDDSIAAYLGKFLTKRNIIILVIIILVIVIVGVIIWLLERKNNSDEFRQDINGIGDGIWWASTILSTIGPATHSPRSVGGRILGVFWMFAAIITISLLIGNTASDLTTRKINLNINSINSLQRIKVGTIEGTSCETFLNKNHIPIARNDYKTLSEGLISVQNNEIKAFVMDEPILTYMIFTEQMNDKLCILPYKLATDYYSFALPKNSDLTDTINTLMMRELEGIAWKAVLNTYDLN